MKTSNWMYCALPALASCAIGNGSGDDTIEQALVLDTVHVSAEGVLEFNTKVPAENPTTLLEHGEFHGYEFKGKAGARIQITAGSQNCDLPDLVVRLYGPEDEGGHRGSEIAISTNELSAPCLSNRNLELDLPVTGEYLIVVSNNSTFRFGHYTLGLACRQDVCSIPGEMSFQSSRIAQTDIDHGAFTPDELFEIGDFLFENIFRVEDGMGNALANHPAGFGPRPNFRRVHEGGFGAPEAQSCITCHNVGGDDGAGDVDHNIIQIGDGVNTSSGVIRNPPVVLGLGLRQQIGIEMTNELQAQLAAAKASAATQGSSVTAQLSSKGVSFGSIVASPSGTVDTTGVRGVDADLVVKPFGWKGREATLRRFVEGGFRVHFGMQTAPSIAKHCATPDTNTFGTGSNCKDPDGDGVVDEITEGQLTAMAVYMGLRETPVRVPVTSEPARTRVAAGEQLFGTVGCGDCHVARMQLRSPTHVEPADTTGGAGITFNLANDMKTPHPGRNTDGSMTVELWSDFKRHDMGSTLADGKPFKNIAPSQFLTTPLWGVATSPPYLHDGRAPTLREAILAHAGEALGSRVAFAALSEDDQHKIIDFLNTLGREETTQLPLSEGVDVSGFTVRQVNAAASFQLPAGTVVPHGGYVIVARSATKQQFELFYQRTLADNVTFINSAGKFPQINGSETFSLENKQGFLIEGPTIAQASAGLQIFQRTNALAPAGDRASWTITSSRPQDANPGSGQQTTGSGRIYLSEIADASGTGNFGLEFVELFVE